MSLDVSLLTDVARVRPTSSGIFVRDNGAKREISEDEWFRMHPGCEPNMAKEAGIYEHLWRPDEIGVTHAWMLIQPLAGGLVRLRSTPEFWKTFNPENGWGTYELLVEFVADYLKACIDNPDATVHACR